MPDAEVPTLSTLSDAYPHFLVVATLVTQFPPYNPLTTIYHPSHVRPENGVVGERERRLVVGGQSAL